MSSERLIFSLKQAVNYHDYGCEVPLERIDLIVQNNIPALRLVLNEKGFDRIAKGMGEEDSLRRTYGDQPEKEFDAIREEIWKKFNEENPIEKDKENDYDYKFERSDKISPVIEKAKEEFEKNNYKNALKNFSDRYSKAFDKEGIKHFRESDSKIVIFLSEDLKKSWRTIYKLKEFTYRGNTKGYDSYHGDEYLQRDWLPLISQYDKLTEHLQNHYYKISEPLGAPLCDKVQIIEDGNALVGISKFNQIENSNPAAADVSVYAVKFYPKNPLELEKLHQKVLKAAYLTPDYYEEHFVPKSLGGGGSSLDRLFEELLEAIKKAKSGKKDDKEETLRIYYSPCTYVKPDENGVLGARDDYISKQEDYVLLREINQYDLKNLFKEMESVNLIEANQQVAVELHNAIVSEYKSPVKKAKYDKSRKEDPLYDSGIYPDAFYDENAVEGYDFGKKSFKVDDKVNYQELVSMLQSRISRAVRMHSFDPENGKYVQDLFVSMFNMAKMTVEGSLTLTDGWGKSILPAIKIENEESRHKLIKDRFEQILQDTTGFKKGDDLEAHIRSFGEQYYRNETRKMFEEFNAKHEAFMKEFKANGGIFGMLRNTKYQDLSAANKSEEERTGRKIHNRSRVKFSQSLIVVNNSLPEIPYFDKRSKLSAEQVNFIPTTNSFTDHFSQKPGEILFQKINLDEYSKGLQAHLQAYLEQQQNKTYLKG